MKLSTRRVFCARKFPIQKWDRPPRNGATWSQVAVRQSVMARSSTQKNFYADGDDALYDRFEAWRDANRRPAKKQIVLAAIRTFLSLSPAAQGIIALSWQDDAVFRQIADIVSQAVLRVTLPPATWLFGQSWPEAKRQPPHRRPIPAGTPTLAPCWSAPCSRSGSSPFKPFSFTGCSASTGSSSCWRRSGTGSSPDSGTPFAMR